MVTVRAGGAPLTPAPPARKPRTGQMPESAFAKFVADVAHVCGWRIAHFRPAQTNRGWRTPVAMDGAGFPDMVLVQPERGLVWFRELKAGARPDRPLDPEQANWRDWLNGAGANHDIWRPADRDDIVAALSNGRMRL